MTTFIPAINHTHNYVSLFNLLKKTLTPILHDVNLIGYEANRITNGLLYLAEMSIQFSLDTISHDWIVICPTVAALLYNSNKMVVAVTRDLCIVIGRIHEDKLIVDSEHIFSTAGIPPIYFLSYDVLLVKVII